MCYVIQSPHYSYVLMFIASSVFSCSLFLSRAQHEFAEIGYGISIETSSLLSLYRQSLGIMFLLDQSQAQPCLNSGSNMAYTEAGTSNTQPYPHCLWTLRGYCPASPHPPATSTVFGI